MALKNANANNVTAGKPKKGGAVFVAPLGTKVPSSATDTLNNAFVALGYISEEGLVNSNSPTTEAKKAWGGDTVLNTLTDKPDTFVFTLLESMNIDVVKTVYGENNVEEISVGSGEDAHQEIKIVANTSEQPGMVWVFDMILKNNSVKRIVVDNANITAVGDINYKDNDAIAYATTITAVPNEDGDTHTEYIYVK